MTKKMNPAAISALLTGDIENALTAMTPGGIEAQERRGQHSFVGSTVIPRDMQGISRQDLEAVGFVFSAVQNDDPLFVHVTLPEGWSKRATDHSMWSEIVDDVGVVRFAVFYKAAFYDRRATISKA